MRRGRITISSVLLMTGALVLAATASAAPVPRAPEVLYPPNAFELEGSNGFTVTGSFYQGQEGSKHGAFAVTASRGHDFVAYTTPARVTRNSVRADLGRLGRVDLRLHRASGEATASFPCSKQSFAYEPGTFEGVFEFHGEGGFTRASTTAVSGVPDFSLPTTGFDLRGGSGCGTGLGEAFDRDLPGARLKAVSYAGGRTLNFQLNKNRPGGKTLYTASLRERRQGIRIFRELSGVAPANAFRFGSHLRTATIAPPAPFSGSAHLSRSENAASPLLTGNLKLAFLGRTVPLAGPAVHISLEHARQTRGEEGTASIGI